MLKQVTPGARGGSRRSGDKLRLALGQAQEKV
jgi:hypothetical protein